MSLQPRQSSPSEAIHVRIVHGHDDLDSDDYHQWVQIGRNIKADRLGRSNQRMMTADWQPWVCNNPDCRGYVLVHLDAVQDLIVRAIEAPAVTPQKRARPRGPAMKWDALDYTCPSCAAAIGSRCLKASGVEAPQPHVKRKDLARVARLADYEQRGYCPTHLMPDCSPLLNGCAYFTAQPPQSAHGQGVSE